MLQLSITAAIVFMIILLFLKSINKNSEVSYKNEIVSLGILGTFIGIAMGLFYFDATNIKDSMPYLLEGLKTAFITSGVGIFFSIFISVLKPQKAKKSEVFDAFEIIVSNFNNNMTTQFGENFKEVNESIKSMILWQENYKEHITKTESNINDILHQIKAISLSKQEEQENIKRLVDNLTEASNKVKELLQETTEIVKENMQLLLREANRGLSDAR